MAFLNSRDASPLPVPAAPAEAAATSTAEKPANSDPAGTGTEAGPQKAENEPAEAKKPGGGEAAQPAQ